MVVASQSAEQMSFAAQVPAANGNLEPAELERVISILLDTMQKRFVGGVPLCGHASPIPISSRQEMNGMSVAFFVVDEKQHDVSEVGLPGHKPDDFRMISVKYKDFRQGTVHWSGVHQGYGVISRRIHSHPRKTKSFDLGEETRQNFALSGFLHTLLAKPPSSKKCAKQGESESVNRYVVSKAARLLVYSASCDMLQLGSRAASELKAAFRSTSSNAETDLRKPVNSAKGDLFAPDTPRSHPSGRVSPKRRRFSTKNTLTRCASMPYNVAKDRRRNTPFHFEQTGTAENAASMEHDVVLHTIQNSKMTPFREELVYPSHEVLQLQSNHQQVPQGGFPAVRTNTMQNTNGTHGGVHHAHGAAYGARVQYPQTGFKGTHSSSLPPSFIVHSEASRHPSNQYMYTNDPALRSSDKNNSSNSSSFDPLDLFFEEGFITSANLNVLDSFVPTNNAKGPPVPNTGGSMLEAHSSEETYTDSGGNRFGHQPSASIQTQYPDSNLPPASGATSAVDRPSAKDTWFEFDFGEQVAPKTAEHDFVPKFALQDEETPSSHQAFT